MIHSRCDRCHIQIAVVDTCFGMATELRSGGVLPSLCLFCMQAAGQKVVEPEDSMTHVIRSTKFVHTFDMDDEDMSAAHIMF